MPELPEVETVRRGLDATVVGRTLTEVEIFGPRTLRRHPAGVSDFVGRVRGRRVDAACRRGKYLWLRLDDGQALLAHLGLSGQLLVVAPGTPDPPHLRARFRFAGDPGDPGDRGDPCELRFVDPRTFGGLALDDGGDAVPAAVAHIGLDPFDPAFDRASVFARLHRRRTGLKRALLDQTLVSGVGNIYADEALWHARLHYAKATDALRRTDFDRLMDGLDVVLRAAVAAGGTSFDTAYVAVNGQSGWFDRSLEVYGRGGEPCSRCGAAIRREAFMNRSSYRCPRCQPVPRSPRW